MTFEEISAKIDAVLDGWFGESLEQSEQEGNLRKNLYQPLRIAASEIYGAGFEDAMDQVAEAEAGPSM